MAPKNKHVPTDAHGKPLTPTQITDRNGKKTTVYKKNNTFNATTPKAPHPSNILSDTTSTPETGNVTHHKIIENNVKELAQKISSQKVIAGITKKEKPSNLQLWKLRRAFTKNRRKRTLGEDIPLTLDEAPPSDWENLTDSHQEDTRPQSEKPTVSPGSDGDDSEQGPPGQLAGERVEGTIAKVIQLFP